MLKKILTMLVLTMPAAAAAQSPEPGGWPLKIPAPAGEVVLPDAEAKRAYDEHRYAAARRVDNMLYVSGVIVSRRPSEGRDVAAFKLQSRRALERLKVILESAGTSFANVVMVNSFHVWQGPDFDGSRYEQIEAFQQVFYELMEPPYPAWTAVGTTGLLSDGGIVEVQLIARISGSSR